MIAKGAEADWANDEATRLIRSTKNQNAPEPGLLRRCTAAALRAAERAGYERGMRDSAEIVKQAGVIQLDDEIMEAFANDIADSILASIPAGKEK